MREMEINEAGLFIENGILNMLCQAHRYLLKDVKLSLEM